MKAKDYRKKINELINEENLLLPDFQRDFVWKPKEQQLQLACSLFLDIPIGSILVLDKLDKIGIRRLCYKNKTDQPELKQYKLLMDGQQRISTIKSIFSNLYDINNWKNINNCLHYNLQHRWFLDLSLVIDDRLEQKLKLLYDFYWNKKFEDYDIEEMESFIISKKVLVKNHDEHWHPSKEMNTIKNYCTEEEKSLLPLFLILSDWSNLTPIIREIFRKYIAFLIKEKDNQFVQDHVQKIKENFKVNIADETKTEAIEKINANITKFFYDHIIDKEIYGVEYEKSQLNKAIVAFNTMNTGGISLGVFDIVSAKYSELNKGRLSETLLKYTEDSIKDKIKNQTIGNLIMEKFIKDDRNFITKHFSNMFLNMLSIFINEPNNGGVFKLDWIKQRSLLNINATKTENNAKNSVESLILAFGFLIERCGVPSIRDIRYKLSVIPIAYCLFKNKGKLNLENKIEYSYWMSLFSGKYEKGQNAFSIDHLNYLIKIINDSENNQFKKYEGDLCESKGYSDLEGFKAFYEDTGYTYSKNIGEYFLQFILSNSYKSNRDIFKNTGETQIKIEHFENLHKDHIFPESWIKPKPKTNSPVHSVLNKFFSPSKRNQERLNNPITEEVQRKGMETLCISTDLKYSKEEFNSEDKIKERFLPDRFKKFTETIKKHLKDLEQTWKD